MDWKEFFKPTMWKVTLSLIIPIIHWVISLYIILAGIPNNVVRSLAIIYQPVGYSCLIKGCIDCPWYQHVDWSCLFIRSIVPLLIFFTVIYLIISIIHKLKK